MRIFITGADGMLGSNLVRLLLERGHEIYALIHPSSKSTSLAGLNIERYSGDILIPDTFDRYIKGADAVIHAAASTDIWPARSAKVRAINITGTGNVIESVLSNQIGRMISYPMASISCEKQYVSSESAVKELNMPQTGIDTAIRECYNWFVENGYLN